VTAEQLVLKRLLNPRGEAGVHWSTCAAQPQLFKKASEFGQPGGAFKVQVGEEDGKPVYKNVVPKASANALASYLLSLKKDDQVPDVMNYRMKK